MTTISLQEQASAVERKYLARVSSSIAHYQSNPGFVPKEGGTSDPVDSTSIEDTHQANRKTVKKILADIDALDGLTKAAVIEEIAKAYPNAGGSTEATGQKFSNPLQALHTKLLTRVLDDQDQQYYLNKDLDALKQLSSTLDQSEQAASIAAKRNEVKEQTAELEARRNKLKAKYSK